MERVILKAPECQVYTDGNTYCKEIYLAEGLDGTEFYLVDESEVPEPEESEPATEEDYIEALGRFGV